MRHGAVLDEYISQTFPLYSTVSRSRMLDLQSVGRRPTYRETESCVQLSCEICEVRRLQYYIIVRKTVHRTHCGTVHLRPHQQATRLHLQLNIYLICVCVLTTVHAVRNQALRVGRESGNNCSRGLTPKAVAPLSPHTLSTHLSALGLPTTSPAQPHNLWVRVGVSTHTAVHTPHTIYTCRATAWATESLSFGYKQ